MVHLMATAEEVVLESNTRGHSHPEITDYDTDGPNRQLTKHLQH